MGKGFLTKKDRSEKGAAFIIAMVALTVLLILGTAFMGEAVNNLASATKQVRSYQAMDLAEAGVDMGLVKLYENYDGILATLASAGRYESSFGAGGGTVNYTVLANYQGIPDLMLVDSTGTTRTLQHARVRAGAYYVNQDAVDRVFRGAIFCDSPLPLNGGGSVLADSNGEGGNIYANGDITFNGTSFTMSDNGHLYTTGTVNWTPPGVDPADVYQNIAPLPMPVIDLEYYRSIATQTYTMHGHHPMVFSNSNLDNLSGVVFVDGDVNITGTYSGKAVIVATGSISVTGAVKASQSGTDTLVLLSPKYIQVAGGCQVEGLIYSHSVVGEGTVGVSGTVDIVGAVVADAVATDGAMNITYANVWAGLPLPGHGKSQWAQISWERLGGG